MLVSSLIGEINYALRGLDDVAPSEGSDEADYWLSVANQKKDDWAKDPEENWKSLWEVRALSDLVANSTNEYDLPTDFIRPSDKVYITVGTRESDFDLTDPEHRETKSWQAYIAGRNPAKLNFNDLINADSIYAGGTITVPGYFLPADMAAFSDTVPVDDPHWLALAVATEIAFNDTSYEDKAPDILAKANDLYSKMRDNNRKGTSTAPRTIPTVLKKIRGATC